MQKWILIYLGIHHNSIIIILSLSNFEYNRILGHQDIITTKTCFRKTLYNSLFYSVRNVFYWK